ncbi:MAG: hypothetical protein Roseis2KO_29870 [Roseivirga sp.]
MTTTKQSGSFLTGIGNPLKGSRYVGLFFAVLVILGALGLAYYFKIESNRNDFREYHFRALDALEDRFDRLIENEKQKISQLDSVVEDSTRYDEAVRVFLSSEKPAQLLETLPWQENFDGIAVAKADTSRDAIIYHSFDSNLKLSHLRAEGDTLNGLEKNVKLIGREYRLFAKNYESSHLKQLKLNSAGSSYTFYGLVTWEEYASTNLRLDVWLIILLATVLLLILIGLPLLKLLFISEVERLFRRDVILAGISVIIGTPILFLVFLSIFQYARQYYYEIPKDLSDLSKTIEKRFTEENEQIVKQLYELKPSFNDLLNDDRKLQNSSKYYALDQSVNLTGYSDFMKIARVEASGKVGEQLIWGKIEPTSKGEVRTLRDRPYFQDWTKGRRPGIAIEGLDYVMRPVLSLEEGTEEANYLIPFETRNGKVNSTDVMVAGVNLSSVNQPILPTGYQFAIIDNQGEVWFHSLPGRSTLENFFNSTLDESYLRAVVDGNIQAPMYLDYMGSNQIAYVNPISDSELFVIALYDTELLKLQTSEALSIGSMGIFAAFLVICFLTFVTIYLRRRKSNFYKYKKFPFAFLEPDSENRMGYATLILFFSIIIIVTILLVYIKDLTPSVVFMVNMLLMIWAYIFVYYRFNILKRHRLRKPEAERAEGLSAAVGSSGNGDKVKEVINMKQERIGAKSLKPGLADFVIIVFILGLNTLILSYRSGVGGPGQVNFLIGIQVLILLMMFFAIFTVDSLNSALSWARVNPEKTIYKRLYIWFLFLWLCLNSILPAFSYFNEASQVERTIWQKKSQLDMARAYDAKYAALDTMMNFPAEIKQERIVAHLNNSVYEVEEVESSGVIAGLEAKDYVLETAKFKHVLFFLRPIYDDQIASTQSLIFDAPDNHRWLWDQGDKQLSFRYRLNSLPGKDYQTTYQLPKMNKPIFLQGSVYGQIVMILLIIGVFLSIFYLVVFFARKIFGFDYSGYKPNDFLSPDNIKTLRKSMDQEGAVNNLAIVGLPNSGKMKLAFELLSCDTAKKVVAISCLNIAENDGKVNMDCEKVDTVVDDLGACSYKPGGDLGVKTVAELAEYDVLIVENFEHGYQSHTENAKKLKLLKELLDQGKQLILLTDIYPSQVLSFYRRLIHQSESPDAEHQEHFNAWHNVFGAFTDILHGFNKNHMAIDTALDDYEKNAGMQIKHTARELITKELGFGNYLPELAVPAISLTEKTDYVSVAVKDENPGKKSIFRKTLNAKEARVSVDSQEFVLQVESLARGYYANIWNSLATRERFIIYDLAKDGFLNIKNGAALFSLMKKGIVIWREKPVLFNKSFRNFIISSISKEEAAAMTQVIKKNGSWGFTKTILYMVMIGLVGFLMIGEPQFVNDFQTFVGVIAGLATVVPVLSSFLGGKRGGA